jgi:acetyl-CoA decarbonylase/synthase complex subunit gamma
MALSGLEIFKLLPKTNCGDCGVPTCMAFAMKLAQKKAELTECPHASDEARQVLGAASEPPIRLVRLDGGGTPLEVGAETVMFRHEKTFYHQPGIGIEIKTSENVEDLRRKIMEIEAYSVERVGEVLRADLFLITHDAAEAEALVRTIRIVRSISKKSLILDCPDIETLRRGLDFLKGERPAVLLREPINDTYIEMGKSGPAVLIITSESLEDLAGQASRARDAGVDGLILSVDSPGLGRQIQANVIARRSALKKNYKPFGYPLFARITGRGGLDTLAQATALLCKYASIIVLPAFDKAMLYTLLTLRQNIYTDPQKPIQVDPKIYPIGEPTPESPVFVTTNFSLTYFIVSGEIENSGISAHLVVCDCEGQSVMTAWAAGKFVGETVAKFFRAVALEDQVKTRKVVIPGYASVIQGDLEEKMPGWEVIVGPQEASDIPTFVKNVSIT